MTTAPSTAAVPDAAVAGGPRDDGGGLLRRFWFPLAAVLALILVTGLTLLVDRPPSSLPLAPDNPRPAGARAVAEILRREGVQIAFRRTLAGTLAATPPDGTILVTHPALLSEEHWRELAESEVDLVVTDVAYADLHPLTAAVETTGGGGDDPREPHCDDPDARAAGRLSTGSGDVRALVDEVVVCFPPAGTGSRAPADDGAAEEGATGAYVVVPDGSRVIRILADSRPLTNEGLDEAGNAALALRVLGRSEHLTWFLPTASQAVTGPGGAVLPPAAGIVAGWGLLVLLVTVLWQGRRLGPVVVEPLPVVVRPAETVLGRARLYRRARAHAHAAAALRAGSAVRLARRIGIPEAAGPDGLVVGIARATGRSRADVAALLYGPPPHDDAALRRLIDALDALESEVRA